MAGAAFPGCGVCPTGVHSSYLRFLADVPSAGRSVVLQLRVRRFRRRNTKCPRRTFVEQIPGLTRKYGQRTERLRSTLTAVGLALVGRVGARLAAVLSMPISRSTVLRLVEALPEPEVSTARVVGVDEYATRKGRRYGTVLVDVETCRPIDLLPDREASSLAAWLAQRPGIEVVCRDRAPFFAEGAAAGAPQAVQVADRWHLWHNLSEAAERGPPAPPLPPSPRSCDPGTRAGARLRKEAVQFTLPTGHSFAERTRAKHATIHALLAAGHSKRSVARQLGMSQNTVQRFSRADRPEGLFSGRTGPPSSPSTSPTSTIAGPKGAPTHGSSGRRACPSATKAATSASAPTCTRSAPCRSR
ncbi:MULTISPECIES: ISL3 family transposase [Streptomyces albogriseolus group]